MIETIRHAVSESLDLKRSFFAANEERIANVARELCSALRRGRKVLLFGNGGSAADCQHIAAEWVGRFRRERRPLAAVALTTDTSILTSVANDYGYDQVFVRQVRALGQEGDVAIAISTSGNSPNVLEAVRAAQELGDPVIAFTGRDGGRLRGMVPDILRVPSDSTQRIQEVHLMLVHELAAVAFSILHE